MPHPLASPHPFHTHLPLRSRGWDSALRVAEDKADTGGGLQPASWDTSYPTAGAWGRAISWPAAPLREPLTPSLLFQQVKSIERFLRRLEFHASKVGAGGRALLWVSGLYSALGPPGSQALVLPSQTCSALSTGTPPREATTPVATCPPAPHRAPGLSLQIDELYEAYCIQRRLRDGAHNMVKAYSTGSPGSREARESLAEASKGYKEYTEVRHAALGGLRGVDPMGCE